VRESAKVSGMVTSNVMGFPLDHGSSVIPSDLLLSLGQTERFFCGRNLSLFSRPPDDVVDL